MVMIEQRLGSDYDETIKNQQAKHGERVNERARVNGQPNGYQPISEAELQARKASLHYAEMSRVMSEELKAEFEPKTRNFPITLIGDVGHTAAQKATVAKLLKRA